MDIKEFDSKLQAIIEHTRRALGAIRANRPTPLIIEDVYVEYAEQKMSVKQLGTINVMPPRDITVTPWDKAALAPIAKAIEGANLGLCVAVQGNIVRVTLPMLSDERRKELVKVVGGIVEESKIKIRVSRDDINKKIDIEERTKIISENEKFSQKKKVQECVDKKNKELEGILSFKIKELTE